MQHDRQVVAVVERSRQSAHKALVLASHQLRCNQLS